MMHGAKNEFIEQIDSSVRQYFVSIKNVPEESEVRKQYEIFYDAFSIIPSYSLMLGNRDNVIDMLVHQYCSDLCITKKVGFAFKDEDVKPWLSVTEEAIEDQNGWFYWSRYKKYLLYEKKWAASTVRTIERDTWNVLDLMANPKIEAGFERRGLVVASVQSGKTANYIGLICRAADAGYKIIIVMAGVHNVLRNQTQARLEDGFTGFNIVEQQAIEPVGVGLYNGRRRPIACTSRDADFNKRRASALKGIQTAHTNEPWLFVIKKNSNSLKQVYEWLRDNASPNDQLLLIDDEADNASINGKYKRERREDEPTRINGQIRNILNYFTRKCYVGYTATPYANILIDPEVDTEQHGKDLFPSSFIYTLEESSDYFGADKVFADYDDNKPKYLRFIDDIETVLPPKHKSDYHVDDIPETLKDAIRTFIVATAIRALRGDSKEHSTMMVNVSPFKAPQKSVAWEIEDYIKQLKNSIKAYAALNEELALGVSDDLKFIYASWLTEYSHCTEFNWAEVQHALYDTIKTIHVVSINSDSTETLEYELHTEHVIAVGGYRLSRGLTLEGLVVSYYSRNAKAYDALMQMARWFGYRPGYEELCRVWMSDKAAGWYKFVADSTADLFDELRNMRQVKKTPKNYGLKIKQSPDSLIVTARNKMGTGTKLDAPIDLNNGFVETIAFDRSVDVVQQNKSAIEVLLDKIMSCRDRDKDLLFREVPVQYIIDFIQAYTNEDARSPKSQKKPVLNYIDDRRLDGELDKWDVFVAEGDGPCVNLSQKISVKSEIRYPGSDTSAECLVVGEKHKLASRGVEVNGLSAEQIKRANDAFKYDHPDKKNTSDRYYRRYRDYPLLIIHPVLMKYSDRQKQKLVEEKGVTSPKASNWNDWDHSEEAYGWSISFPYTPNQTKPVNYVFNQIAINDMCADYEEESDDDYGDE